MIQGKIIGGILVLSVFMAGIAPSISFGQEDNDADLIAQLQIQIQDLLAQVQQLQGQISQLQGEQTGLKEEIKELRLEARQLRIGIRGEDVKLLQELLKTDPAIYPEGLVTGYFGSLTEKAVRKFQKKFGIDQVGEVGPITRAQINRLLKEGAGKSGKVPPGLLRAPGILKKLGFSPEIPEGQTLPRGIAKKLGILPDDGDEDGGSDNGDDDTTAPVISSVAASSSASTTAQVAWTTDEEADGVVWYGTGTPVLTEDPFVSVNHVDLIIDHNLELSGLTASTTYNFIVVSKDAAGNEASSTEAFFTTL